MGKTQITKFLWNINENKMKMTAETTTTTTRRCSKWWWCWWNVMCTNNNNNNDNERYKEIYILCYVSPNVIVLSLQALKLLFLAFSLSLMLSFGYSVNIAIVIVSFIAFANLSSTNYKIEWPIMCLAVCMHCTLGVYRSTNDIHQKLFVFHSTIVTFFCSLLFIAILMANGSCVEKIMCKNHNVNEFENILWCLRLFHYFHDIIAAADVVSVIICKCFKIWLTFFLLWYDVDIDQLSKKPTRYNNVVW